MPRRATVDYNLDMLLALWCANGVPQELNPDCERASRLDLAVSKLLEP
jgi:hypothetical protein